MKAIFLTLLLACSLSLLHSQHTFSIVAVDSVTGEIGSAGATCGDSIIWPGTPGAYIISMVLPGRGAIHTQSYWVAPNQTNAGLRMQEGKSPQEIMDWLQNNDAFNNPAIRQYGAVDYNNGHPRSAAFTGSGCMNYKNHITGPGYAIQGNILLGQQILDSMEARYLRTPGSLADKLMASMQGAKVIGADTRCAPEGTSSLSAFIRVAKPADSPNALYLDINVAGTGIGIEPIDVLQSRFDRWNTTAMEEGKGFSVKLFPNPTSDQLYLEFGRVIPDQWQAFDVMGKRIAGGKLPFATTLSISTHEWAPGVYQLSFWKKEIQVGSEKLLVQKKD